MLRPKRILTSTLASFQGVTSVVAALPPSGEEEEARSPMTLRDWTDPRDGRHWRVRQTGLPTVLVFASEDDLFSVVIDFNDRLEDRSDAELERLLDEGRGSS